MSSKNIPQGTTPGTFAAGDDSRFSDIVNKAAKGANSDITSLSGLTTALSTIQGGTGTTSATGSGANVLATSPSFITPNLGTPSAVVLTNATGLPLSSGTTGSLPLASGGTGATSANGARTNLGLGTASTLNVGTASGTVAAGDDNRLTAVSSHTATLAALTINPTATKTSAYTALAQDLVLTDATSGGFTVTLPTAPADNALVEVKKLDAGTNTITVSTGGSDTYSIGGTSLALLLQGQAVTWRYQASTSKWIAISNDLPFAAAEARYLTQANAATNYITKPSGGLDGQAIIKSGSSTLWAGFGGLTTVPPVGGYSGPSGISSYGYNAQTAGRLYVFPFWIGPTTWTADAFRLRISQARVGATGFRKYVLYPDAGGYPDTSVKLATATLDDTQASGNSGSDYVFTGGAVSLTPGLYWGGAIVYYTGTVTTVANSLSVTDVSYALPTDTNNAPDAKVKSLFIDGLTDLPTTKQAQSAFQSNKDNSTAVFFMRRSA